MLERHIQFVGTDEPGMEEPAATRERLKECFPPGLTRRMTQLGMLTGALLAKASPGPDDAVVYASQFGESRALEAFLDSFPTPSPTLFQTSIHPSAAQQVLIARQRPVREFFPMAGDQGLIAHALLVALLAPSEQVVFCGGEERGTWLTECGAASNRAFAFAAGLVRRRATGALGRIAMTRADGTVGSLSLSGWFDLLHRRRSFSGGVAPGWEMKLEWQ